MRPCRMGISSGILPLSDLLTRSSADGRSVGAFHLAWELRGHFFLNSCPRHDSSACEGCGINAGISVLIAASHSLSDQGREKQQNENRRKAHSPTEIEQRRPFAMLPNRPAMNNRHFHQNEKDKASATEQK